MDEIAKQSHAQCCEHGSLKRQCELCDRDADIAELREEVERLTKERNEAERWASNKEEWIKRAETAERERDERQEEIERLVADFDARWKALNRKADNSFDAKRTARAAALEEAATAALKQRCERGTPWDDACVALVVEIRKLK